MNWANKWTLTNETTRFSPAIIGADPGRINLAWTGTDGSQSLNLCMLEASSLEYPMEEANPNGIFDAKITYPTGSVGGPALAPTTKAYDLIFAWAGLDGPGNLYSAYIGSPFAVPTP